MDQELLDLIARLRGDSASDGNATALSDEELTDLRGRVVAIVRGIDRTNPTADDIAAVTEARAVITAVDAETTARAEQAAANAAEINALLDGIEGLDDPETDPEATPAEGAEVDPAAEPAAEATPADGDPTPAEPVAEVGEPAPTVEATPEPVAAAATPPAPTPLPRISHLAHRRPPARNQPLPEATRSGQAGAVLVASADIPGLPAGQPVDLERWAHGVSRRMEAFGKRADAGADGEKVYFGSIQTEFPEDRYLDDNEAENERKIQAVVAPEALVASGGVCGPVNVDYSIQGIVSQAGRPVRDAMAGFGASRGGLRYIRPFTMAGVTADGPAGVWTEATDATPGASTKVHATFNCQSVQEDYVDAITSIVQFGNFQARFFAEQVAAYMQVVDAVHARLAEATLLAAIATGSTATVAGNNGTGQTGAASEYLAEIDRASAAMRYRHRMAPETPLRLVYPEWFEDMMRADLARELPGNSGGQSERLAVADAEIDAFFRARNINVTNTQDNPTGASVTQGWGVQGVGDLLPWPTKVISWLYPEGAWMFLDGGELNLGMVRDSTLNKTNDFQMFSETFEKAIFRGVESLQITMDLCADGARAASVDTSALCTSGS